jgi:microcystin-dependent protein
VWNGGLVEPSNLGQGNDGGHMNWGGTTHGAGEHAHNITVGEGGWHQHEVGIAATGDHAHGASAAAAPDHQHAIAVQGGNAAHPNMQPSLAINIMVKL